MAHECLLTDVTDTLENIQIFNNIDTYPLFLMQNQVYNAILLRLMVKKNISLDLTENNVEMDERKQEEILKALHTHIAFNDDAEETLVIVVFKKVWESQRLVREIKVNHETRTDNVTFDKVLQTTGSNWSFKAVDWLGEYYITLVNSDPLKEDEESIWFDKPRITIGVCYDSKKHNFCKLYEKTPVLGYYLKACSVGLDQLKIALRETSSFF